MAAFSEESAMSMRSIHLAALMSFITPMAAGAQDDPYANTYRKQVVENYKRDRDALADAVENYYLAVKCRVFGSPADVTPIIMLRRNALVEKHVTELSRVGYGIEPDLSSHIELAARSGNAEGRKEGACDFFRDHPEAVADLRRAATHAAGVFFPR